MSNEATNSKPKRGKRKASSIKTYLTKFRGSHPMCILALILSIIALIVSGTFYYKLNKQINDLRYQIFLHEILTEEGNVDLTNSNIQGIGNGFYVAKLSVEQHLTGVKVKGRVINSMSLIHESVEFQIKIAGQAKDFTVNRIPAGGSAIFEVYVPDVPVARTKFAVIKYNRSAVLYR
jgi:hypothetical protein